MLPAPVRKPLHVNCHCVIGLTFDMRERLEHMLKERGVPFEAYSEEGATFRVPAKDKSVGDLKISVGEEEVVVWVGPTHTHTHFDRFSLFGDVPEEQIASAVAEAAADYVTEVLEDRVLIEVVEQDGRIRQVGTYRLPTAELRDRKAGEGAVVRRYVWSGPYGGNGS